MYRFFLGFCLLSYISIAQTYNHNTFWGRLWLMREWKNGFSVNFDAHYRTQNNYHNSKANLFKSPLLKAERLIFGYRQKKWFYTLGISHWKAYPLLGKEADFLKAPANELRIVPTLEYTWRLNNNLVLHSRTQQELRFFRAQTIGRFRQRFQARYFINKSDFFTFGDELLMGTPPNSSKELEQNQLTLLFQKRFTSHLESEIGYRYLIRNKRNSPEIDLENALVWTIFIKL